LHIRLTWRRAASGVSRFDIIPAILHICLKYSWLRRVSHMHLYVTYY